MHKILNRRYGLESLNVFVLLICVILALLFIYSTLYFRTMRKSLRLLNKLLCNAK